MSVNRRDFVAAVGLSALASAGARAATPKPHAPSVAGNLSDWSVVREQFDLSPLFCATGAQSRQQRERGGGGVAGRARNRLGITQADHANNL